MVGTTNFKCMCPPGFIQIVANNSLLKQTEEKLNITSPVCSRKNRTVVSKERSYRGTLNGGLFLDNTSAHSHKKPLVGLTDDLRNDAFFNYEKMRREHEEKPEHFGIHLSKLKSLENERVKDRETEIISDIFR